MTKSLDPILTKRVAKVLPDPHELQALLDSGKKLRIYQGYDPTAAKLHFGHTIGMRKLMEFANRGHQVIMLFGTGTVLVGDPSERDTGRKLITQEEIDQNIKSWKDLVSPIVDFSKVTIKQNGDWLTQLSLKDIVHIASNISAVQLFKRDSFQRRIKAGNVVWYHETLYPLLQGYDSVILDVDIEVGGTDQEFNMLVGRELQHKINHRNKFVITNPMIMGTDGQQMSKSSGNCIWLDDTAIDIFGKTMSIPDSQIAPYLELLTDLPSVSQSAINQDPLHHKKLLAFDLARQIHGSDQAKQAQAQFEHTIQSRELPDQLPQLTLKAGDYSLLDLLAQANLGTSNAERKRLITQGGVELNQTKHQNPTAIINLSQPLTVKFGKRTYLKIIAS